MTSTVCAIATIILTWLICESALCQGSFLDSNYSGFGLDVGYSKEGVDEATVAAIGFSAGGDVDIGLLIGGAGRSAGQSHTLYGVYGTAYPVKQGRDPTPISIALQGTFLQQHKGTGGTSFALIFFSTYRLGRYGLQPRVGVGSSGGEADRLSDKIVKIGGLALFANFDNRAIFFISQSVVSGSSGEFTSVSSGLVFPFGKKPRKENTGRKRQPSMCVVPPPSGRGL